jgi:hypothetical protein
MYIEDARNTPLNVIDSFSITYDNNNRIVGLASPNLKTVYTYNANTSFTMDLYVNNQLNIHEIGWVNGNLLVDSTFQYNNANDSSTEKYTYSGKLLTRKSTYLYSAVTGSQLDTQDDYSYDNNGNAVKDIQSDGNGNVYIISTLTYTNQLLNYSISAPYFVPLSKNLPATEVQTDGSGNAIGSVNITYVYDNSGRVKQQGSSRMQILPDDKLLKSITLL